MWKMRLLLGLLLLVVSSEAKDLRPDISREAAKCATAVQQENASALLVFMSGRVVQQSGGRAAVIAALKDQFEEARKLGVERIEIIPGVAGAPKIIGHWLLSLLPVTAVAHSAHVVAKQETHAIALSADGGRHWSFVPLYQTSQAELNGWFPEFRGRFTIPAEASPQIQLVY